MDTFSTIGLDFYSRAWANQLTKYASLVTERSKKYCNQHFYMSHIQSSFRDMLSISCHKVIQLLCELVFIRKTRNFSGQERFFGIRVLR